MAISFDTGDGPTMNLNDDEQNLLDEISIAVPEKKTVPLRPKPARPSPFAKRAPGPTFREPAPDEGLDMFNEPKQASCTGRPASRGVRWG